MWLNFVKWAKFLTCVKYHSFCNIVTLSHCNIVLKNSLYLRVFLKEFLNS